MAFNISSYLNEVMPITYNDANQMDVDLKIDPVAQAMAKAQEHLHVAMEVQNKEKKQWVWVEEDWKVQRMEGGKVVVWNKEVVVEAREKAVSV